MKTKRIHNEFMSLSWSELLGSLCVMVLALASMAAAFTPEIKAGMLDVAGLEKLLSASSDDIVELFKANVNPDSSKAVLGGYQKFNLMGLVGENKGGVVNKTYQPTQVIFHNLNNKVAAEVLSDMKMVGT